MSKQTLQDRYVAALEARGCKRVPSRTRKYVVLLRGYSLMASAQYWYVGKSGAIRTGASVATSVSVSDKFKAALLAELEAVR